VNGFVIVFTNGRFRIAKNGIIVAEGWKYLRTCCVPLRTENPWILDKYNGDGHAGMVAVL